MDHALITLTRINVSKQIVLTTKKRKHVCHVLPIPTKQNVKKLNVRLRQVIKVDVSLAEHSIRIIVKRKDKERVIVCGIKINASFRLKKVYRKIVMVRRQKVKALLCKPCKEQQSRRCGKKLRLISKVLKLS